MDTSRYISTTNPTVAFHYQRDVLLVYGMHSHAERL